jgi:transcriptional regulator with XRE-family HTH domain
MDTNEFIIILNKAMKEWKKTRIDQGVDSLSIEEFARELGASQPTVTNWLNNKHSPTLESIVNIAPKLAELLGPDIYEQLGIQRPDPTISQVIQVYDKASTEEKVEMLKMIREWAAERGYQVEEQLKRSDQENEP